MRYMMIIILFLMVFWWGHWVGTHDGYADGLVDGYIMSERLFERSLDRKLSIAKTAGDSLLIAVVYYSNEFISPSEGLGLIMAESSGYSGAVSSAGAIGWTQVMPSTAGWFLHIPADSAAVLLTDRIKNVKIGFYIATWAIKRWGQSAGLAWYLSGSADYNADEYIRKVLTFVNSVR